jgi:hypothetical protein
MDPATRLLYVEVAEPDMHEPSGDFERLAIALRDQWQVADVRPTCDPAPPAARPAQGRSGRSPSACTATTTAGAHPGHLAGLP